MKEIPLTQGKVAIVDDEDYENLNQWKWQLGKAGYAVRGEYIGNYKSRTIQMHRVILNEPKGMCTDHINMNKLDNRRCNLRICTRAQNNKNIGKYKGRYTSKYKGVCLFKRLNLWCACIESNKKRHHLGYFRTEAAAAIAYNKMAKKLHGEFARLNEVAA